MSFRAVLIIYNILLPIAFLLAIPAYVIKMFRRGGYGRDFAQRFGFFRQETRDQLTGPQPIWIHAVSVGEIMIAHKLIRALREAESKIPIVLSCTTSTGRAIAEKHADQFGYTSIYNPFDFSPVVTAVFRKIKPKRLVLVEAEMWPNLLNIAKKHGIPIILVNARLSPRSERRYQKFSSLTSPLFGQLDGVQVQVEEDIDRWANLGVVRDRIRMTGSIKSDQSGLPDISQKIAELRQLLNQVRGDRIGPVVLAGSTHADEEAFIGQAIQKAADDHPGVFYVVAPRHAERSNTVAKDLKSIGYDPVLKTDSPSSDLAASCLIVNTTGELNAWYHLADIVLVGKSFLAEGGQNPIEPLVAGKPVITGPNMQNFAAFMKKLVAAEGGIQLSDSAELETTLQQLLNNPDQAAKLVANGTAVLAPDQGAASRSAVLILGAEQGP
ncbi:MAG: 3-deoxy-D-manno-octulosonic acid transferase [Verrucomicrobiota bacterium]